MGHQNEGKPGWKRPLAKKTSGAQPGNQQQMQAKKREIFPSKLSGHSLFAKVHQLIVETFAGGRRKRQPGQ
jgi:hypothetical protein